MVLKNKIRILTQKYYRHVILGVHASEYFHTQQNILYRASTNLVLIKYFKLCLHGAYLVYV